MQLLSQVFSIKMLYRQLITITLYKNFSLGLVVMSLYIFVLLGNLSSKGTMLPPHFKSP